MRVNPLARGAAYRRRRWFRLRWRAAAIFLAAIPAFAAFYALILPAVTMEKGCSIPEHTHTALCYETRQVMTLTCPAQPHVHTAGCLDGGGTPVCGEADFFVHVHTESCYGADSTLLCPLPQIREHSHGEACYTSHTHTPECYTRERGTLTCTQPEGHTHDDACTGPCSELVCTLHTHGEECWTVAEAPLCDQAESESHTHTPECYRRLTCGQTQEHTHGEECYVTQTRTCPLEENHTHNDECWSWTETLTCEIPVETPVLTCDKKEAVLHTHGVGCYDGAGTRICGKNQLLAHVHGADCFTPGEIQALTCTQEAHTHTELCAPAPGNLLGSANPVALETTAATEAETTGEPLTLNPTSATLSYKEKNGTAWTTITNETKDIPGDATFQLEVGFQVNISDLKTAGYQMKYSPLPEWFRNVKATDAITDSQKNTVGTMTVENGVVTLNFNPNWTGLNQESMTGSFYVEAQADLKSIPDSGKETVVVGDTTINVNFAQDLVAQYGEVTLKKEMGELEENQPDENGVRRDYIPYTLTVTAGADGCPDVTVTDTFTAGKDYIEEYIIPEEKASQVTVENKTLTWKIGNMEPNETQTLTYKVRLDATYLGVSPKNTDLTNLATVNCGEYQRATDSETFVPKGGFDMSKRMTDFHRDDDGGGTVKYTVWIQAYGTNTYTMENAAIRDSLDGWVGGSVNKTDEALLPHLSYVEDSFRLYEGGCGGVKVDETGNATKDTEEAVTLTEITPCPPPTIEDDHFTLIVGDLKPGEGRTLTYEVKIDPGAFTTTNEDFVIKNRAAAATDPTRTGDGGQNIQWYNRNKTITAKKWARKLLGSEVAAETTFSMTPGSVYGGDTETNSFTVPAGSYKYQVVVNEDGDWDVSSAVMKDALQSDYLAYVGYVRVDAYTINARATVKSADDEAVKRLEEMTPTATKWVKIEGDKSFSFTPKDIGLEGKYAYLLTYYAQPTKTDFTTVIVANAFDLTGTVGIGDKTYTLAGIHVSASVTLEGSNHFAAQKKYWCYDANTEGQKNGTLYWVLKLDGSTIPAGTMLLDTVTDGKHTVGGVERAFIATSNLTFPEDGTLPGDLTEFTGFTSEIKDNGLELTLPKVELQENQSLWFVVSTHPTTLPEANGTSQTYENTFKTRDPAENAPWVLGGSDTATLVGGETIYKSLAGVYEVKTGDSGLAITPKSKDAETKLQTDHIQAAGSGVYVAWKVRVNYGSTLSGQYRITENIPEGMEVVYIQRFSTGSAYTNDKPVFAKLSDMTGYTEVTKTYTNDTNPAPAYYYLKGQEAVWEVSGLKADRGNPGTCHVDFLVLCKVTDKDLYLGGNLKTYQNTVTIANSGGKNLGTGSADVTLSAPKLTKTAGTIDKDTPSRYPFVIQLNDLGADMVPGADEIFLIDEMSDSLILDPASIQVVNTVTKEEVKFTSAVEGKKLTLTLPDNLPLTITYEANVNAAPGQTVRIENKAYWQGYANTTGDGVTKEDFSYSVGATVDTTTNPELTIKKVNQYDTNQALSGAQFTLTEMKLENGTFVEAGQTLTGTTAADGTLVFGTGESKLQCNVPYCLVETAAPEGFVVDSAPKYFLFYREKEATLDKEAYQQAGAILISQGTYTHTAYNHKGEITVNKVFQDGDGSELPKIDGTYSFGLYKVEDGVETWVQTVTLTWANGVSPDPARFTNVELGKTYVVYELDDKGDPIKGEGGTVSKRPFLVSYTDNTIDITATSPTATVTVTNRVNYPELPLTGGMGTAPFHLLGALLTLAALALLKKRPRPC